ncbi:hypothetical protein LTS18_008509 [Coniosporium uncinatum]|uniref:Uncharacterized protein n=1 Tax=Coniosporium uncinatum TaxID=93489 RepID=A0ACC3DNA4_9PEZI|nr:hypothetical protein LTS18_008509 [Coniosporium uncinatum]
MADRPIPVLLAQANFIPGGVLLAVNAFNTVLDSSSIITIMERWARHCRMLASNRMTTWFSPETDLMSTRTNGVVRLSYSSKLTPGFIRDHPEYHYFREDPAEPPPCLLKQQRTQVFYFSNAALAALERDAAGECGDNDRLISRGDALCALIWRSLINAERSAGAIDCTGSSTLQVTVDGRTRMSPPLAQDFLGCTTLIQSVDTDVRTLLDPTSLYSCASAVRRATDGITPLYIDDVITMLNTIPDYTRILPYAYLDVLGKNVCMTSWANFDRIYEMDWGVGLGKCERVRVPNKTGLFNGLQIMLPELPQNAGGGIEVIIALEKEPMKMLKQDKLWSSALRNGGCALLKSRPAKIVEILTSKPGKYGHAKVSIEALDVFNGKKYQDIAPAHSNMEVPFLRKKEYFVLMVSADGFLTLFDEAKKEVLVVVLCAMGEEIVVDAKEMKE